MTDLNIAVELSPVAEDEQAIRDGLRRHNDAFVDAMRDARFAVFVRDADDAVRGGLLAKAGRGWLQIGSMWIDPAAQRQGYGTALLAAAEAEGLRLGCHSAYLDTFSFQAHPFYERCGFEVFGTLEDFPDGHQRYFMRKKLD